MMKKNTTKATTKAWYEGRDTGNPVTVLALVKKKIYEGEKVTKWCLELASYNSNTSKYRRSWIVALDFDKFNIKEGDVITCNLTIVTNSNNDKMTTDFILNDVEVD